MNDRDEDVLEQSDLRAGMIEVHRGLLAAAPSALFAQLFSADGEQLTRFRFDNARREAPDLLARRIANVAAAEGGAAVLVLSAGEAEAEGQDWARRIADLSFGALREVDLHLLDHLVMGSEGVSSVLFGAGARGSRGRLAQQALEAA